MDSAGAKQYYDRPGGHSRKILHGPPKPRDPRRPIYYGCALVVLALIVGAYGLGKQHGRSDGAARCGVAFDVLADRAGTALAATLRAQRWRKEATEYADMMRAPEVDVVVSR